MVFWSTSPLPQQQEMPSGKQRRRCLPDRRERGSSPRPSEQTRPMTLAILLQRCGTVRSLRMSRPTPNDEAVLQSMAAPPVMKDTTSARESESEWKRSSAGLRPSAGLSEHGTREETELIFKPGSSELHTICCGSQTSNGDLRPQHRKNAAESL